MLYPYPASVPTADVINLVIDAVNKKEINYEEAAHAAWVIAGYGLSLWDTHPMPMFAGKLSDETICQALESLKPRDGMKAAVIPWGILLPILFEFIIKWLGTKP